MADSVTAPAGPGGSAQLAGAGRQRRLMFEHVFDTRRAAGPDRQGYRRAGNRFAGTARRRVGREHARPAGRDLGHGRGTRSRVRQAGARLPSWLRPRLRQGRGHRRRWRARQAQLAVTSTSSVALISGCSLIATWCAPTVLIGFLISIRRLSSSGPPAASTAAAISAVEIEPNSLPPPPALFSSRTVSDPSLLAASLAASRPMISRTARARLISSICFPAARVQRTARPRGTR